MWSLFWWITWGNFNPFIAERQYYESFSFGHFITQGLILGHALTDGISDGEIHPLGVSKKS
jgi:hypothetical protein